MILVNIRIYGESRTIEKGYIAFNETIEALGPMEAMPDLAGERYDLSGYSLIPGFIDQHIHGLYGYDAMDGTKEALAAFSKHLPEEGTTSFLATTMTEESERIERALKNVADYRATGGAECLGVHLEGPFISPVFKGAQSEAAIRKPSVEAFGRFYRASNERIKEVTLAPEREGGLELVSHLKRLSVVPSIGHSNATGEETKKALANGARCFTHAYNAMKGLHHRDPGVVGTMLLADAAYAEIIADRVHTGDDAIRLLIRNKTDRRVILITDAMRAKGLADGTYELGGQKVIVKGREARLSDGTLAGSVLRMIDGVKNVKEITGATIESLIRMASTNAAENLGVADRKGTIGIGKDADLLVVDDDLSIVRTYCRGVSCYQKR
ncbi:MAG: N-acetylglucosamine-6-phosphate deacetylase [Acholeplasmataceae bacterium]